MMSRLPVLDWRKVVKVFEKVGWRHDRTRGSHYIMVRPEKEGLLSIPMHSPLKRGTLHKLIKQSGLTIEEFLQLLKDDP